MIIPSPSPSPSQMDCMITADVRDMPWPGAQHYDPLIKHDYAVDAHNYIDPSPKFSTYHHRNSSSIMNCDDAVGLERKMISANYPSEYVDNIACSVGGGKAQQQQAPALLARYHCHDRHHPSSSTFADPAPAQAIGTHTNSFINFYSLSTVFTFIVVEGRNKKKESNCLIRFVKIVYHLLHASFLSFPYIGNR